MNTRLFFVLMAIAGILGFAYALAGCAHQPELTKYDTNHTRKFFCQEESCPAFAKIHNYTLLSTRYDESDKACKCQLMSDNMPDSFEVSIPIGTPADAPIDSL